MMFLLLALVMQVALDASLASEGRYRPVFSGVRQEVDDIPDCNSDLYIHERPCTTLIFTPSTSSVVQVRSGPAGTVLWGRDQMHGRLGLGCMEGSPRRMQPPSRRQRRH
jgi:hypothetical protein